MCLMRKINKQWCHTGMTRFQMPELTSITFDQSTNQLGWHKKKEQLMHILSTSLFCIQILISRMKSTCSQLGVLWMISENVGVFYFCPPCTKCHFFFFFCEISQTHIHLIPPVVYNWKLRRTLYDKLIEHLECVETSIYHWKKMFEFLTASNLEN